MDTKPSNTTKKPKTAKQMEAFKRANDAKNERLRKWREENLRREARGEEPLVWATKAKARKDAVKAKEKEDKLHSLFLKSLEIQKKQLEDDEEKARIDKLKIKVKPTTNTTRRNKPIRKDEYEDIDDYYTESDSEDDYEEQPKEPLRSEPLKLVKEEKVANVDDIRAEFLRGEQEAQYIKALLQQQKQQQQQPQPAPQPQTPARPPAPAPQPQTPAQPAPRPQLPPRQQPQQPNRQEAYRTEPLDKSEIAKRPQYATREDFDDLKKEIINKIQQPNTNQIKVGNESYNLITDTKVKKPIEPPKYTTDINYVYNQQTLQKPIEQQKPINTIRSAIEPAPEPPAPAPNQSPTLSEERLRSMMGMKQRYEIAQQPPQPIQYTTNSVLLNRMFFNHN
jgi:hypothetical protein